MTWRKREIMNEQERELDFMVAELEHENTLMRSRNTRLEAEVTLLTEMVRVLSDRVAEMEAKHD
jgi:predicted nuclease with TOPRIM domain